MSSINDHCHKSVIRTHKTNTRTSVHNVATDSFRWTCEDMRSHLWLYIDASTSVLTSETIRLQRCLKNKRRRRDAPSTWAGHFKDKRERTETHSIIFLYKCKMTQCLWLHIKKIQLNLKTHWSCWSQCLFLCIQLHDSTCCAVTSLHWDRSLIYSRQMDGMSGWALVWPRLVWCTECVFLL